jgi:TonB family protein
MIIHRHLITARRAHAEYEASQVSRHVPASVLLLGLVLTVHVVGVVLFTYSTPVLIARSASAQSVTAFLLPKIRDGGSDLPADISALVVRLDRQITALHIDQPQINFEVVRNGSALSAAPTLIGISQPDMRAYVRQASLSRGEGATVVLRIEVLESGDPGRIQIDASSGSRQIDQAAIDYARTLHWNAGRVNGVARAVWIRWGVRLQA